MSSRFGDIGRFGDSPVPTLQYPPTGPATYKVTIAKDGAIKVQQGDWLSKYSMCLHGVPDQVYEYGRLKQGQMTKITEVDWIDTGEIIYHLPTREKGRPPQKPGAPKNLTPAQREKMIDQFLREQADLPKPVAAEFKKILSRVSNGQRLAVLLAELGGLELSALVAAGSPLISAIAMTIGNVIALLNAASTGLRNIGRVAYCYGFTAWTFRESKPGYSQNLARSNFPGQPSSKDKEMWSRFVDNGFRQGVAAARNANLQNPEFQVILQAHFESDAAEMSRYLARQIASRIANKIERKGFESVVFSAYWPCVYNK